MLYLFALLSVLATPLWAGPHDYTIPAPKVAPMVPPSATAQKLPATLPPANVIPAKLAAEPFQLGIERLGADGYKVLQGRHIGVLTHAAAVDRNGTPSIDLLRAAPGVTVAALYAPEHGLDGLTAAEKKIDDKEYNSIPVFSIYGATRKPTPEMLKGIDLMVVDLQDVGVRSYTYISAMKLTMQACFEQKIPVLVLDRPNPLGGLKVDGPVLDTKFQSYVGMYQIPYIHGLTIGELARWAEAELRPLSGTLTVITMRGWKRDTPWSTLPLNWKATSPAVQSVSAAYGYACTGLGAQLGGFRHGYGTDYPFRLISHPKITAPALRARLMRAHLNGFEFIVSKTPKGDEGVYVKIISWNNADAIGLSLTMLQIAQELEGQAIFKAASESNSSLFNKHWGRAEPLNTLKNGKLNAARLAAHWRAEALRWQAGARKFWLY